MIIVYNNIEKKYIVIIGKNGLIGLVTTIQSHARARIYIFVSVLCMYNNTKSYARPWQRLKLLFNDQQEN